MAGNNAETIERLTRRCVLALTDARGKAAVHDWAGFKLPQPLDYAHLVSTQKGDDGRTFAWLDYLFTRTAIERV